MEEGEKRFGKCLRVDMPGDNRRSDNFYANLKKETVPETYVRTRDEARQQIFASIEGDYHTSKVQKRLDYEDPMQR